MNKPLILAAFCCALAAVAPAGAQSLDDLNIQLHGYATQGFLYTTNNNILTTSSSNGSPDWTEAVVNLSATPVSGLRVAVQGRYELLGNYANQITLDYAAADYKVDENFGVRFGKVKIPSGLFNEIQDIDPSYMWALLPQSVYPISSRNGQLALFGGVGYGTFDLKKLGKLEYRAWGGEAVIPGNDGYWTSYVEEGINFNELTGVQTGGALHWKTPLTGLMIGLSDARIGLEKASGTSAYGALNFTVASGNSPDLFARYEKKKLMVAGEYHRQPGQYQLQFGGPTAPFAPFDLRAMYAMATYKITDKLTAGVYDSDYNSHSPGTALGPAKYSKDWTVGGRYDFSQYLYAKAEEHFIDGTSIGYDTALNPNGLKPNTKLTVLKVGVSF